MKPKEIPVAQELSPNPYNGNRSPIKRPDQKSGLFSFNLNNLNTIE
jgi:hypothetical protein